MTTDDKDRPNAPCDQGSVKPLRPLKDPDCPFCYPSAEIREELARSYRYAYKLLPAENHPWFDLDGSGEDDWLEIIAPGSMRLDPESCTCWRFELIAEGIDPDELVPTCEPLECDRCSSSYLSDRALLLTPDLLIVADEDADVAIAGAARAAEPCGCTVKCVWRTHEDLRFDICERWDEQIHGPLPCRPDKEVR